MAKKQLLCLLGGELNTAPRCASYVVYGYGTPNVPTVVCRRAPQAQPFRSATPMDIVQEDLKLH